MSRFAILLEFPKTDALSNCATGAWLRVEHWFLHLRPNQYPTSVPNLSTIPMVGKWLSLEAPPRLPADGAFGAWVVGKKSNPEISRHITY